MQRLSDMDHDDDDGIGYVADTRLLRPSGASTTEMTLLHVPGKSTSRQGSFSSSVSDLEEPIYDRTTSLQYAHTQEGNGTTKEKVEPNETDQTVTNDKNSSTATATTVNANSAAGDQHHDDGGFNGKLAFAIAAAALGSAFQHGYNTGVVNAPQKMIEEWIKEVYNNRTGEYPTDNHVTFIWSVAVAIFCVGGMIGASLSGWLADRFGRKGGLLVNNVFVLLAAILEGSSKSCGSYEMIIIGRLLLGINSGINAAITPMYLMEIAPINLRGSVGTVYQLVITISILISQVLGLQNVLGTEELWPVLLALTIAPGIFQMATLPLCPESPKFLLLTRGQELEAQRALSWLRGSVEVHEEMDDMRAEYEAMKLLPKVTLRDLLTNDVLRIPMIIAVVMMLGQQLSGINAVVFFSTKIFKMANLTEEKAQLATLGMGVVNVVMTIISLVLVEKAGRKTLLLVGYLGMLADTVLLTLSLIFVGSVQWLSYCCILLVYLYMVFFATGPGSIPWFLVSEMFSQAARPTAQSIAVTVNWTANTIVSLGFLPVQEAVGPYVFIFFVICLILTNLFVWKKVPETKNKTVEEITSMFRQQSYQ